MLKSPAAINNSRLIILSCFILLVVFLLLSIQSFRNPFLLPNGLFSSDEADYMYAGDRGFFANYVDKGTQSISSFITTGLKVGLRKSEWSKLSESIRESNDICFYRHFHGPLYFYWLNMAKLLGFTKEIQFRYASLLFLLIAAAALVIIAAKLFPAGFMVPALIMGFVLMASPSNILTANHVSPHGLYMVLSLVCLGCAAIYCKTSRVKYWYLSIFAASLAFMTIEYSAFLLLTLLGTLAMHGKPLLQKSQKEKIQFFLNSCLCFFAPLAVLWPGGLIKLSFLKGYFSLAYLTIVRPGAYGSLSPEAIWLMKIKESPAEYLLLLLIIIVIPFILKKMPYLIPLLIYSFCLLVTALRNNSPYPTYFSSLFPPLYLVGVAEVAYFYRTFRNWIGRSLLFALCIVFVLDLFSFLKIAPSSLQCMPYDVSSLNDLRLLAADTTPVFINSRYILVMHYYFPQVHCIGYNLYRDDTTAVFGRIADALGQSVARPSSARLIWDHPDAGFSKAVGRRFLIIDSRKLFISEIAPATCCYTLSLK